MKYRKLFYYLEKYISNRDLHNVVIMLGLRKTGKTTILKQLRDKLGGIYVDFRNSENPVDDYIDAFDAAGDYMFLDEIGHLPDFDAFFGQLEVDAGKSNKRVVLTSSSYGTLKQLSGEVMGGGRSHTVELFPLSFEEYLYFTGKIKEYGDEYETTDIDLQNFYRLIDIPLGMEFSIDEDYFDGVFLDTKIAYDNQNGAIRDVELTRDQYRAILDILAYTLNNKISLNRFKNMRQVGRRELGVMKGLSISKSLISMAQNTSKSIDAYGISKIIHYLYHNGYLFADVEVNIEKKQDVFDMLRHLAIIRTDADLIQFLKRYNLSVITPLLYTRLLVNLESIANKLCESRSLYGELYELTMKSEYVYKMGWERYHCSYKYVDSIMEVDLVGYGKHIWEDTLLLETAIGHKKDSEHYVNKIFPDSEAIRVLTDVEGTYKHENGCYRIGYPKALLMMSNDNYYDLELDK